MRVVIEAFWDDEAKVWVASSIDDLGLATEAETIEALQQKLSVMVPDLLQPDHEGPVEVELLARNTYTIAA
ncbi:DUF1902 domain-containing protein [Mesorhizobium sp. RP14(2022)]|uniref:DUF1902 domain-containing protein n=1 Tax=Mesorhizobium liriopis TaxID=2953882 RepID=A0ABT1C046_9HYPH|nr:DUF1902 domain-containing protein [Mesorhizobium liriopis]MCO6048205.1 DUF1902 domain-containing protein [Mesorhizobium liriopis]